MTLTEYLSTLSPADRVAFRNQVVEATGITAPAYYHWLAGRARPSQRHAMTLVTLSGRALTLPDLRPEDYS